MIFLILNRILTIKSYRLQEIYTATLLIQAQLIMKQKILVLALKRVFLYHLVHHLKQDIHYLLQKLKLTQMQLTMKGYLQELIQIQQLVIL